MASALARDVMTHPVLTIREDRTLGELTAFLSENSISGAPVVDAQGALVGVVTVTDLAEREAGGESPAPPGSSPPVFFRREWEIRSSPGEGRAPSIRKGGLLVRDIMTPVAYSIPGSTPVGKVAQTMIAGRIHRLLVTEKGRVAGIVTTLDLLQLLSEKPRARRRSRLRYPEVSTRRHRRTTARG
jgi:CBS domain-containing protein